MNPLSPTSRFASSPTLIGTSPQRDARDACDAPKRFDEFMLKDIGLTRRDVDRLRR